MAAAENHKYKVRIPIIDGYDIYTSEFLVFAVNPYHALAKAVLKIRGADDFGNNITVEEELDQ